MLGCGWWLATLFQSPEQLEANATAPSPGPVFSIVAEGSLAEEHTFTGKIGPSSTMEVNLLPAPDAAMTVVTGRAIGEGDIVSNGGVLIETNGRPVLLAQAPFPFYRDMGFGDQGPDVEALQRALSSAGYSVQADGRFGVGTAQALQSWYKDAGYIAPTRPRPEGEPSRSSRSSTADTGANRDVTADSSDAKSNLTPLEAPKVIADAFMPVAEVVGMTTSSAKVLRSVPVGTRVAVSGTPDIVLGSSEVVVSVSAAAADVTKIVEGDTATISLANGEIQATIGAITPSVAGKSQVSSKDAAAGTAGDDVDADTTFLVIPRSALDVPTGATQARVTVVKNILPEQALLVPVLAVTDRGSGNTVVHKRQQDGTLAEIPVRVLGSLNGQVAVAASADSLVAGEEVRVG
ncbi:peptidoglycan-binding protein [Microbacterium sp. 20-116]|uniref:peptidoglycan-binding domain-containing protein n=1 Tax=unclassified Microbacterium TaxID=2609290 RepID=UPI00226EDE35|nr:peptidoglycan-binding domain-containing protein [Microbacterium sp. SL75]WAC70635.1 peptidoglycan-binding domain-containing protein [Microbacterium sp. SL75]